jgi:hypothetical protein
MIELFGTLEKSLGRVHREEMLDPEIRRGLEALGYVR